MKKSKLILLIIAAVLVVALVCVVIFCSDGWFKQKWKKVIDGSLYEKESVASKYVSIPDLADKNYRNSYGELAYFTGTSSDNYEVHSIYNLEEGKIVFTKTENKTTDCSITLSSMNNCAYFVVTVGTCSEKNGYADWSDTNYETTLYDASGKEKATASRNITASQNSPFLVFDDTYFEINEDAGIKKVFEKNPLGKTPSIDLICGDYYIGSENDIIIVYDKKMNIVSSYVLPGYAEMTGGGVLSNDKLIFQYTVEVDPESNKYDILEDGEKYDIYTIVFNVKNGKAKEIKCKYLLSYVEYIDGDSEGDLRESMGLNNKISAIGFVYPIVNKRIDDSVGYLASLDKNGNVKLFEKFNSFDVKGIKLVNTNRWAVTTTSGATYLVNEKFEIIGDVTYVDFFYNAGNKFNEKYIAAGGKLYDYNLKEVFDYEEEKLSIVKMFSKSVLFNNTDGEYYLYSNDELTQITLFEEVTTNGYTSTKTVKAFDRYIGSNCYAIYDYSDTSNVRYIIYNCEGEEIVDLSVNKDYFRVSVECSYETNTLISVETYNNASRRYETNYYVIK